jgi:hypothetical protein
MGYHSPTYLLTARLPTPRVPTHCTPTHSTCTYHIPTFFPSDKLLNMDNQFYLRLCCMTLLAVAIAIPFPDEPFPTTPQKEMLASPGATTRPKETLTRANVFTMILSLCFSCLTQPYGLLLVTADTEDTKDTIARRLPNAWYGTHGMVDKTWLRRLSPITSLVEGFIILFCLLNVLFAPLEPPVG